MQSLIKDTRNNLLLLYSLKIISIQNCIVLVQILKQREDNSYINNGSSQHVHYYFPRFHCNHFTSLSNHMPYNRTMLNIVFLLTANIYPFCPYIRRRPIIIIILYCSISSINPCSQGVVTSTSSEVYMCSNFPNHCMLIRLPWL